jgi:lipopolysaccharide transport system ATP-binding protein
MLPLLRSGRYSIAAQIAAGTVKEHVQLHWIHDAMVFTVHSDFQYDILMSIPMRSITMTLEQSKLSEVSV